MPGSRVSTIETGDVNPGLNGWQGLIGDGAYGYAIPYYDFGGGNGNHGKVARFSIGVGYIPRLRTILADVDKEDHGPILKRLEELGVRQDTDLVWIEREDLMADGQEYSKVSARKVMRKLYDLPR